MDTLISFGGVFPEKNKSPPTYIGKLQRFCWGISPNFCKKNFFHLTKDTKKRKFGVYKKFSSHIQQGPENSKVDGLTAIFSKKFYAKKYPSIIPKDTRFRFATVFT